MTGATLATLGDLKSDYKLHAHCSADLCHHNAPMDTATLCKRLGDDFPLCDLAGRMCCTNCGGRRILTIISPIKTGQCDDYPVCKSFCAVGLSVGLFASLV